MRLRRILLGLLVLCWTAAPSAGAGQDGFAAALAAARESTYAAPSAALARLERLKQGRSGAELGLILVETSRANYWLGRRQQALDAALQAERLGRAAGDSVLLAKAMLSHGLVLSKMVHDQQAAGRLVEQAAALARATGDPYVNTRALVMRGLLADQEGRTDDALALVAQGAAVARAGRDPDALVLALREQARLLAAAGQAARALGLADQMLAVAGRRGMPAQLANARLTEYVAAARAGNPKRAEQALLAAIDLLERIGARERLAEPLANLAELQVQARRYGEAARTSQAALRTARAAGDAQGARLAAYQLGIATIYFRDVAQGRRMVDAALEDMKDDERYVRKLLEYGHALGQVGWGDQALTVYEKASTVSLAAWRKEKQLSYQALQRARADQKKQAELAALQHDGALKAAELGNVKRLRALWAAFSATTLLAVLLIALLYRRVKRANGTLALRNQQLFHQSTRDSLTGLHNRHYFYEHVVPRYHALAGRDGKSGGVFLLIDVDHFKAINDRHGHGAGDLVLRTVAARLAASLREQDLLVRWGGEEFLAWLPGVAMDEARQLCARLLAAVAGEPVAAAGEALQVSVSAGFCPRPADGGPDWEKLVHLADLCLYLAKTAGRNQAFGVADANALTPAAIAAADADLGRASADGLLDLVNVRSACAG